MMKTETSRHRKRIGLFIENFNMDGSLLFLNGINAVAGEENWDVILVCEFRDKDPLFSHNMNYRLIKNHHLDGIILLSHFYTGYVPLPRIYDFFSSHYQGIPIINIGTTVPQWPSIIMDNRDAMRKITDHLIEVHGCSRLAYINSSSTKVEFIDRYKGFNDSLAHHGLRMNPDHYLDIEYKYNETPDMWTLARQFLDKHENEIDAIVTSGDPIALIFQQALAERTTYHKISVTGFDGHLPSEKGPIAITTIQQPCFEMTHHAGHLLAKLIKGESVPQLTILPATLVINGSCGCTNEQETPPFLKSFDFADNTNQTRTLQQPWHEENTSPENMLNIYRWLCLKESATGGRLEHWKQELMRRLNTPDNPNNPLLESENIFKAGQIAGRIKFSQIIHYLENSFLNFINLIGFLNRLSQISNIKDFQLQLREMMPLLGVSSFLLVLFDEPSTFEDIHSWTPPADMEILFYENRTGVPFNMSKQITSDQLFPEEIFQDTSMNNYAFLPMFVQNIAYGYMLLGIEKPSIYLYEPIRYQISSIVHNLALQKSRDKAEEELKQTMQALEKANGQLFELVQRDQLTGLYNRRGFDILSQQHLATAKRTQENFLIIFSDLDGLKIINDVHGHGSGDHAIALAAKALKQVFRESDIIARIGGDEFVILATNTSMAEFPQISNRLRLCLDTLNSEAAKPYNVSFSLGAFEYDHHPTTTIAHMMYKADEALYEEKSRRKTSRKE